LTEVFLDESPPRMLVYRSKFGKTRWVPLHVTAVLALRQYLQLRDNFGSSRNNDVFFTTNDGQAINRITLHNAFQRVIAQTAIRARGHQLRPSLNSLRHTFAVHRLHCWYKAGEDVRSLLPNLSVYLGHSDPVTSYWYLTCTPELMVSAGQRFQLHSANRKEVNNVEDS
jgi:integrase